MKKLVFSLSIAASLLRLTVVKMIKKMIQIMMEQDLTLL